MIEIERLREAFATGRTGDGPHPSDDRWEALALDELGPDERAKILEHVLDCPECREIHRTLLTLRENAHTFDDGAPRPEPRPTTPVKRRVIPVLLALAAAALFIVVLPRLGSGPNGSATSSGDTLRGSNRTAAPIPLEPIGPVDGGEIIFSWKPASPPVSVELLDAAGEIIWTGPESDSGRSPWPKEIEQRPGVYYWRVLPAGDGRPPSDLVSFEITAPR